MLSVVIPALDAEQILPTALNALNGAAVVDEVVVADGGSADGTRDAAAALGARVVSAPRGRGPQLAAGAAAARGDWLLFFHADTVPARGWEEEVRAFMAGDRGRAAYFRFALDDERPAARRLERLVDWRCRRLGLPYGDQGLLTSRELYEAVGGYRSLPVFEDVDMARRVGRRRLVGLGVPAVTSAVRYRKDGYLARPARNLACLALYYLGVPARMIEGIYR